MTEEIEKYINNFPNIIDPCTECSVAENKRDKYKDEGCLGCCFYYPSHFKLKKDNKAEATPY